MAFIETPLLSVIVTHILGSGTFVVDWTEPKTVTVVAAYAVGFCDTVIPRYKMGLKSNTAMVITTDSRILRARVMVSPG